MDTVEHVSMLEHIRKRVGMYWPTHDGIPDTSIWIFFLDQLANEMGDAFMRGEASYVDICYDSESKAMSIECDGRAATDDLRGVCKGEVSSLLGGDRDLGGVDYAMITALSHRMEIEICKDGEWSSVQCVDGAVSGIVRMFPEIMGTANRVRVSFSPSKQFYKIDEQFDRLWPDWVLQGLGNGLSARCPGLAVSVNGHRYVYKNGVQGLVEELLKPFGGGTLMRPRSVTCKDVSVACGAARRGDSIRRVFGEFYLNGREVKNQNVMGRIMEIPVNQLIDNCHHASSGYDFVFVVNGYCPNMYFPNERIYAYDHETWYPIHDHDYHYLIKLKSQIAKCMLMAFKEYMK